VKYSIQELPEINTRAFALVLLLPCHLPGRTSQFVTQP